MRKQGNKRAIKQLRASKVLEAIKQHQIKGNAKAKAKAKGPKPN
jgi:hypothetical protein